MVHEVSVTEAYLETSCQLGESPAYNPDTNVLTFCDLKRNEFHTINLDQGPSSHKVVTTKDTVAIYGRVEGEDNLLVAAANRGFASFDPSSGELKYLTEVWDDEDGPKKFNDGNIDAKGRFWAGTMFNFDQQPSNTGVVWRFDPDGSVHRMIDEFMIPNGIAWSPDNKTMYFTDSIKHIIYQYDFDLEAGSISNKRPFATFIDTEEPDGMALDAEGGVWSAVWNGGRVERRAPSGEVTHIIRIPAHRTTCPTFAGKDFDELFITTASLDGAKDLTEEIIAASSGSGHLFRVKVDFKGLPKNKYTGKL